MAQEPIARLGDTSDHDGSIVTVYATKTKVNEIIIARVEDLHFCPKRGHGLTKITNGSGNFKAEGRIVAVKGSKCGCGAVINSGSSDSKAPFESPANAFKLNSSKLSQGVAVG